jgi:hypothetical protein
MLGPGAARTVGAQRAPAAAAPGPARVLRPPAAPVVAAGGRRRTAGVWAPGSGPDPLDGGLSLAGVGLLGSSPFTLAGTSGIPGTPGVGTTGTSGLIPGTAGDGGGATSFAPLRPSASGALPFTGAASDLLAVAAAGLLAAGALFVRATRPADGTEGGEDR